MAVITETIGSGGTYATIDAWRTARPNPLSDLNLYIGELIDEKYEIDAGALAFTGGTSPSLYHWLRAASGNAYRPERHTGARVYVRWTGSSDQAGIRIAENFFRMSGFAIICEDPQEVTGGNKWGVKVEADDFLAMNMFVRISEGGGRDTGSAVAPFFYCYYVHAPAGTADRATFLNCIAMGSPYFKGANHGFYFDSGSTLGGVYNCAAFNITRFAGATGYGFSGFAPSATRPTAVNCIAGGTLFGFGGTWRFLVDPAVDTTTRLGTQEPYQCIDSANSLPFDVNVPRESDNRNRVEARSVWGRPDVQDFRPLLSSLAWKRGRDMSAIWSGYTNPEAPFGNLTAKDFDGVARPAQSGASGPLVWAIGPYETKYSPAASVAPTVEVKSIGATGRDYATIQAWLDATDDMNLVYTNKVHVGELYDDGDFAITAGQRVIARRTIADATHYRHLRPAAGQAYDPINNVGVAITGTGGTTTGENNLVEVLEDFFRFSGPVLVDQTQSASGDRRGVKVDGNAARIDAIFARFLAGTGTSNLIYIVRGSRVLVTNCIARGSNSGTNGATTGFRVQDCERTRIYNCAADRIKGSGSGIGFREGAGTVRAEIANSIATDCTTGFSHATAANAPRVQGFNIASDTTADGPNSQDSVTAASLYVSAASSDYRSLATSSALKRGASLATRFSADYLGARRFAPFDIGPHEGVPTGPLFPAPQWQVSRAFQAMIEVYRKDGALLLFTDQCEPVAYAGRSYQPGAGFVASNRRGEANMRERSVNIRAALSSAGITATDLAAGKYRGMRVREVVLGRYAFTQPLDQDEYIHGDADFDAEQVSVDLQSLSTLLTLNAGGLITVGCPLELGGEKCGKDITPDTIDDVRVSATIQNLRRKFNAETADISGSYADDFFGRGALLWLTGANAGAVCQVKNYVASTRTIELEESLPYDIAQNDTFQVKPGCRKRYLLDCIGKFSNGDRFGGDALMPGTDKALSTPTR